MSKFSPKWPWPWNYPHFCKKWKYFFKNPFFYHFSWNFTVWCIWKFLICCFLQKSKIPISLENRAYFRKLERVIFSRKTTNFKMTISALNILGLQRLNLHVLYITEKDFLWTFQKWHYKLAHYIFCPLSSFLKNGNKMGTLVLKGEWTTDGRRMVSPSHVSCLLLL